MCRGRRGNSSILLSRTIVHRGQLSNVFGRNRENAESKRISHRSNRYDESRLARRQLRHAGDERHADLDRFTLDTTST